MRSILSVIALAAAMASATAQAQPAPAPNAPAVAPAQPLAAGGPPQGNGAANASMTRPAPEGLYQALGEQAGITRLVDDLLSRAVVDARIGHMFKNTKIPALKESITLQICVLVGGPCIYEGDTMKASHADLGIAKGDFNRLVELLQFAMDAQSIPFTQQNRLLALLAPMHRDVITKR